MAHTFNIPINFESRVHRPLWVLGEATPCGWVSKGWYGSSWAEYEVVSPSEVAGYRQQLPDRKELRKLDAEVGRVGRNARRRFPLRKGFTGSKRIDRVVSSHFADRRIQVLVCYWADRTTPRPPHSINAWSLRDEFVGLERNPNQLVEFLNRWGAWSEGYGHNMCSFGKGSALMLIPADVWDVQDEIRQQMVMGSERYFGLGTPHRYARLMFHQREQFPHFHFRAETCEQALYTSLAVDFLLQARFKLCARPDCQKPFRIESRHERKYCSQYCGHLESLRKKRKE